MSLPSRHDPTEPRKLRHVELLIALVGLLVIQSFLSPENWIQRAILNGMFLLVVLSAVRSLSQSRIRLWISLALSGLAYGLSWADERMHSHHFVIGVDISFLVIFVILISVLAEDVFREGPVDTERIVGAVSIFFLLGLAWAFVYALLELLSPGSFSLPARAAGETTYPGFVGEFIYFSNVTLTTLGYGDTVPLSAPARTFASLQAMMGQLYLAIVIARMVGMQISQRPASPPPEEA